MKNNIALIIICTGAYHRFIEPLLDSARKYFLVQDSVTFYLFTDNLEDYGSDCVVIPTKHEQWPGPTLHRYRNIINSKSMFSGMDYIFYTDVDMLFVDHVGREILGEGLTGVLHPGFYSFDMGAWGNDKNSTSYTQPCNRKKYFAGGVQGGKATVYLSACTAMDINIKTDEKNGVLAQWHDETHWNKLLSENTCNVLTPEYCMVEEPEKRALWRIDHLKPRILALAKNHKEIRTS